MSAESVTSGRVDIDLEGLEVFEEIGRGGVGIVYRAKQTELQRDVAVKVLHRHFAADPSFLERLRTEAMAVARLKHRNVLMVFDVRAARDGTYSLILEYVPGCSLSQVLKQSPSLDTADAIFVTTQILQALEHAHSRGIIHRDIKPGNVLIDADGRVVVGDFGLAKVVESEELSCGSGPTLGTPMYMAPEIALGKPVDERADLYSVGVVLFQMLCGTPPFRAANPLALLNMHANEPVPSEPLGNFSPELASVVRHSLAKVPDSRFQNAREFIEALSQAPEARSAGHLGSGVLGAVAATARRTRPSTSAPVSAAPQHEATQTITMEARPSGAGPESSDRPRALRDDQQTDRIVMWVFNISVFILVVIAIIISGSQKREDERQPRVAQDTARSLQTVGPPLRTPTLEERLQQAERNRTLDQKLDRISLIVKLQRECMAAHELAMVATNELKRGPDGVAIMPEKAYRSMMEMQKVRMKVNGIQPLQDSILDSSLEALGQACAEFVVSRELWVSAMSPYYQQDKETVHIAAERTADASMIKSFKAIINAVESSRELRLRDMSSGRHQLASAVDYARSNCHYFRNVKWTGWQR